MTLAQLKDWISSLPAKFNDHHIVYRKIDNADEENWYCLDAAIVSAGIDEENGEIFFLNSESTNLYDTVTEEINDEVEGESPENV